MLVYMFHYFKLSVLLNIICHHHSLNPFTYIDWYEQNKYIMLFAFQINKPIQ